MQENNTIQPTHSCFDDAMEFIDYVALEYKDDDISSLTLVHGIIQGDDGKQYVHAWVEEAGMEVAIFAGFLRGEKMYFYSQISEFYDTYKVQETTRYTLMEAFRHNLRTYHFGPWEPKYVAISSDSDHHSVIGGGHMRIGTIGKLPTRKEVAK